MGGFFELGHTGVDLAKRIRLFDRALRHIRHQCGNVADAIHDDLKRIAGFIHQIHTIAHACGTFTDETLNFPRCIGGFLRQRAHLRGHNRKSTARIARTSGLNPGVQRQQVGLKRDVVDHTDDLGNLV